MTQEEVGYITIMYDNSPCTAMVTFSFDNAEVCDRNVLSFDYLTIKFLQDSENIINAWELENSSLFHKNTEEMYDGGNKSDYFYEITFDEDELDEYYQICWFQIKSLDGQLLYICNRYR